jgi:hypothetical protein
MRGARELPPAAPDRCSGARGATPAAAAAGEAPYRGSEAQGSLWMVLLATAVVVCGSLEFGTCVRTYSDLAISHITAYIFVYEFHKHTYSGENFNLPFLICFQCGLIVMLCRSGIRHLLKPEL